MKKTLTYTLASISITFTVLLLLFIGACKKECNDPSDPACGNYNPCYGKSPTSAKFTVYEAAASRSEVTTYWQDQITDTILRGACFRFVPDYIPLSNDTANHWQYTWIINDRDTFPSTWPNIGYTPLLRDTFSNNPSNSFKVKLIVSCKRPNKSCFPSDNGKDTFSVIMQTALYSSFLGTYQGHSTDNPSVTYTVSALYEYDSTFSQHTVHLYDLVGCAYGSVWYLSDYYSFRAFSWQNSSCASLGYIYVDKNKNVTISYIPNNNNPPVTKTFIGKQIYRQY